MDVNPLCVNPTVSCVYKCPTAGRCHAPPRAYEDCAAVEKMLRRIRTLEEENAAKDVEITSLKRKWNITRAALKRSHAARDEARRLVDISKRACKHRRKK